VSRLLSVKEAAAELKLSTDTIYKLCSTKQLQHERHGPKRGTIRIPEEALSDYRNRVTVDVKEPSPKASGPAPSKPPFQLKHLKFS
jgi:excisionase family DNA binding protein